MSETQAPVVIVGTGLAGYSLAREFRKLDPHTPLMLITADDGRSYSKPMLSTGFTKTKTAAELAMADPAAMADQLHAVVRTYTTVTGLDPTRKVLHLGDEKLAYSKLVLAWGADVIRPAIEGDGAGHIHSINDLMDYHRFREALVTRKRVVILGAGLIGCEFANDLRNGGFEVDVVAPCDTALPGLLPEQAGRAVARGLELQGVRFHFGPVVTRVDRADPGVAVILSNGETLTADIVVSAIGLRPRIELARDAGLQTNRGIVVNRALETTLPDVYALGDCAEVDGHVLLYVLPLMAGARALAKTLSGDRTEVRYGAMPVVIKTPACPVVVAPPPVGVEGSWTIQAEDLNVRALFHAPDGKLLGFALTGRYIEEKQALARDLPPVHR
jgi:rubredoxin---NAD+ reductase